MIIDRLDVLRKEAVDKKAFDEVRQFSTAITQAEIACLVACKAVTFTWE